MVHDCWWTPLYYVSSIEALELAAYFITKSNATFFLSFWQNKYYVKCNTGNTKVSIKEVVLQFVFPLSLKLPWVRNYSRSVKNKICTASSRSIVDICLCSSSTFFLVNQLKPIYHFTCTVLHSTLFKILIGYASIAQFRDFISFLPNVGAASASAGRGFKNNEWWFWLLLKPSNGFIATNESVLIILFPMRTAVNFQSVLIPFWFLHFPVKIAPWLASLLFEF